MGNKSRPRGMLDVGGWRLQKVDCGKKVFRFQINNFFLHGQHFLTSNIQHPTFGLFPFPCLSFWKEFYLLPAIELLTALLNHFIQLITRRFLSAVARFLDIIAENEKSGNNFFISVSLASM